jgi:3-polyprenyl-4-hydroxybenzoate decarboxylase
VDHTLARVLDRFGLQQQLVTEWQGTSRRIDPPPRG